LITKETNRLRETSTTKRVTTGYALLTPSDFPQFYVEIVTGIHTSYILSTQTYLPYIIISIHILQYFIYTP